MINDQEYITTELKKTLEKMIILSSSPDEDKSLADSKALIPVLKDFFEKHPLINPKTFWFNHDFCE